LFCGKPEAEVERMVAGPDRVFICNQCVALCQEIIDEERTNAPQAPEPAPLAPSPT